MPMRWREYDTMLDDGLDTRIPAYSDDAFRQGIQFNAKYIGSMEVAKPQSRLEIVSSMRKIRYEFKMKGVVKKKVLFTVSTEGVFIHLRSQQKKRFRRKGVFSSFQSFDNPECIQTGQDPFNASNTLKNNLLSQMQGYLLHHPIYRIFYVSHDSQDLKIFSYIARDGKASTFKCHVFKAYKKVHAMRIVRTVGQAFDVCHRLNLQQKKTAATTPGDENPISIDAKPTTDEKTPSKPSTGEEVSPEKSTTTPVASRVKSVAAESPNEKKDKDILLIAVEETDVFSEDKNAGMSKSGTEWSYGTLSPAIMLDDAMSSPGDNDTTQSAQLKSNYFALKVLQAQLEQQREEARFARNELQHLQAQLKCEMSTRNAAQEQIKALMMKNMHLLNLLNEMNYHLHQQQTLRWSEQQRSISSPQGFHPPNHVTQVPSSSSYVTFPKKATMHPEGIIEEKTVNNDSYPMPFLSQNQCFRNTRSQRPSFSEHSMDSGVNSVLSPSTSVNTRLAEKLNSLSCGDSSMEKEEDKLKHPSRSTPQNLHHRDASAYLIHTSLHEDASNRIYNSPKDQLIPTPSPRTAIYYSSNVDNAFSNHVTIHPQSFIPQSKSPFHKALLSHFQPSQFNPIKGFNELNNIDVNEYSKWPFMNTSATITDFDTLATERHSKVSTLTVNTASSSTIHPSCLAMEQTLKLKCSSDTSILESTAWNPFFINGEAIS